MNALVRQGVALGAAGASAGMNDRELAGLMEYVGNREGSPRSAFPPVVSSGPKTMTVVPLLRENCNAADRQTQVCDLVFAD